MHCQMKKSVDDYKASGMAANAAKAKYRQEWMAKVYSEMQTGRDHNKSYTKINKNTGTYEPFAVIVEKM
eukprot:12126082-Alexandrium_andersonii.AAC.1